MESDDQSPKIGRQSSNPQKPDSKTYWTETQGDDNMAQNGHVHKQNFANIKVKPRRIYRELMQVGLQAKKTQVIESRPNMTNHKT